MIATHLQADFPFNLLARFDTSILLRDGFLIFLVALGLCFQLACRRLPAGLGTSLFVGLVSLAAGLSAYRQGPSFWNLYFACHITSALCVLWAMIGWLSSLFARRSSPPQPRTTADTFFAWAMVTGVCSAVLTVNTLVMLTLARVLNPSSHFVGMPTGMEWWDLAAMLMAALFWMVAGPRPQQPAVVLALLALLIWWSGLMIPPVRGGETASGWEWIALRPHWWNWEFQLQAGLTVLLVGAAVVQDLGYRNRRKRAWPDRLEDLIAPYGRWPMFIQIESIIAGAVLILGVYQIVSREPMGWPLAFAGFATALAAGVTALFMTYRRWSANTASLGIALLTLSGVLAACGLAALLGAVDRGETYADRIPVLFNAVLFALALAFVWWRWMARVWDQQLLDGVSWTTAGHLIPLARRASFIIAALAMLAAFQMALWPELVAASGDDNTRGRIFSGAAAIGLLTWITAREAVRTNSISKAALSIALAAACICFIFVRLPTSPMRGWLIQYRAVVLAFLSLPILVMAEFLPRTRWRSFAPPLWTMALLILPAAAMLILLRPTALPTEWVRPLTLAILGALYSFAGSREHRRALLVLGIVLLVAAATGVYNSYRAVLFG